MPRFGELSLLEVSILWLLYFLIALTLIVRDPGTGLHKVLWIVLVILFPCLGFLAYLFLGSLTQNLGRKA